MRTPHPGPSRREEIHLNDYQDIHEARERIEHFITQVYHQKTPAFGVRVSDTYGISTEKLVLNLLNFGLNKRWYFKT